ncbi:MAG: GvpL/GvpF family gas vesicle protein [Chloroflexi bacterium]|nr:GvpL/GvpF family gas vesicle protein [Chloroflexota bacterium]
MSGLLYVYAVAGPGAVQWLERHQLEGIGGARVRGVTADAVIGAVSEVPAAEFDQEPLDRNVADATWLGPRAASHQEVNARLLDGLGAVLPLAFGTIFRSEDRVRSALRERGPELATALAAVAGRAEWVITLDRDDRVAGESLDAEPELRELRGAAGASAPGRAYLLRTKLDNARRDARRRVEDDARAALRAATETVAEELTDEPLVEGGPVARATALVPRDHEGALRRATEGFNKVWSPRGYAARVAGPWPAYRYGAKVGSL